MAAASSRSARQRSANMKMGKPGSPTPPPPRRCGRRPRAGIQGNRVAPYPRPLGGGGKAQPTRRDTGKPGSPIPPLAGRCGRSPRAGGWGNRVSPHPPTGRCGRRPRAGDWGNQVSPHPRPREGAGAARAQGAWRNQVSPRPRPQEGLGGRNPRAGVWGNQVSPYLRLREGLGGHSPPRNNLFSCCSCAARAAWTTDEGTMCRARTLTTPVASPWQSHRSGPA